jgi:DNA repair photolyase
MFPSSHDITPINLSSSIKLLQKLLEAGNEILIVSKPHLSCIKEICSTCKDYKSQVLFRFTIGSADNKTLKIWEPNAPSFEERLECLKYSYEQGYQTSVSCEPMLDNQISAVIEAVIPYVTDAVWIGTINNLMRHLIISGIDSPEVLAQAEILLAGQNVEEIKRLYNKYKDVDKIKWKSSIKKIIGIPLSDSIGADN